MAGWNWTAKGGLGDGLSSEQVEEGWVGGQIIGAGVRG